MKKRIGVLIVLVASVLFLSGCRIIDQLAPNPTCKLPFVKELCEMENAESLKQACDVNHDEDACKKYQEYTQRVYGGPPVTEQPLGVTVEPVDGITPTVEPTAQPSKPPDIEELSGHIAVADNNGLIIINFEDGKKSVSELGDFGVILDFAWSPDGSRLAFTTDVNSRYYLLEMINIDGSGRTELARSASSEFFSTLVWSPDGKEIAYDSWEWAGASSICLLDVENKTLVRKITPAPNDNHFDIDILSWSADGDSIFFLSGKKIYIIGKDGSNMRIFRESPGGSPIFSPDGSKIAYLKEDGIHVLDLNTSEDIFLARTEYYAIGLSWSPAGNWIAFTAIAPENIELCQRQNPPESTRCDSDVWVVPEKGGQAVKITDTPDISETNPAWGR